MMNEEQRKLAEDNHNLIYSFMNKKMLNEDWYGVLAEAYCNAIMSYDSNITKLSTYVFHCLENKVNNVYYLNSMQKRRINSEVKYFSEITDNSEQEYSINEIIGSEDDSFNNLIVSDIISEFSKFLTKSELDIFNLMVRGFDSSEIKKELNINRQWLCYCKKNIKNKFKSYQEREALKWM